MSKTVSIVIVTLNRREFLRNCLDSVFAQTFKDFEVLVVDGGSTDGTLDLVKHYKALLVFEPNGLIKSYNKGLRGAHGEFVVFVDDDVVVSKNWLERIIENYDACPRIAGVGGRVLGAEEQRVPKPTRFSRLYDALFYRGVRKMAIGKICQSGETTRNFHLDCGHPISVDYILGCNMSFRKELAESIGGFDENYQPQGYLFEPDLCIRLKHKGYTIIFDPSAVVYHHETPKGTGGTRKLSDTNLRAKGIFHGHSAIVYFFLKNFTGSLESFFKFALKQIVDSSLFLYFSMFKDRKEEIWALIGKIGGVIKFITFRLKKFHKTY